MTSLIDNQRKININELPAQIPNFSSTFEPKDSIIKKWIINWILSSIKNNQIKENDIIPSKADISAHLGVSIGTVQNAIRYVEDEGYLKSKQRLGTMISNFTNPSGGFVKSTSKRDKTINAIKKIIVQNNYKIGKSIPSTRQMAVLLGISQNTTRLAYEYLQKEGILISRKTRGNDANWILNNYPQVNTNEIKLSSKIKADTLVEKITGELKVFLSEKYNIGDKIPSNEELASALNVSIKTIHDCIKNLSNQSIVISRRGRYGTILAKDPLSPSFEPLKENSIFTNAQDSAIYHYQKIEMKLINLIKSNFKPGDKLPSMKELSENFNVSTNTIRKALQNLASQGYITFGRGRFGGTFLIEIPDNYEKQTYQWLSINPNYI